MRLFQRFLRVALLIVAGPVAASADCSGIAINTPEQLRAALRGDLSGKTLALGPGDYGALKISGLSSPKEARTRICSADPGKPAEITGLILRNAQGLILEDLKLQYRFQLGDNPITTRPFRILNSAHITLRGVEFSGDVARGSAPYDNGFGAGKGLFVSGARDLAITGSEFHTWHKAVAIHDSQNVVFSGNDIHSIRSDGLNISQVENMLIERNHIHDFLRSMASKDHADMIQIWTTRTDKPSRNITIRSNLLNSGSGKFTQSIYISNRRVDRDGAGHEMFYRNTRIENNVIINAHLHGITVAATDRLEIVNNTLIRSHFSKGPKTSPKLYVPTIRVSAESQNVTIARNITPEIVGCDRTGHQCQANLLTQENAQSGPTHVSRLYVDPSQGRPTRLLQYRYRQDGPAHGQNLGSDLLVDPN